MPARLYLMPIVGVGTYVDPRRPMYQDSILRPHGVQWGMMDYGWRPVCMVGCNTDDATHNELIANTDVQAFPDDFQSSGATIGGALTAVRNRLEDFTIPAAWVQSTDTYAQVAHSIGGLFQYMQRINRIMGDVDPFPAGITLNTQFQNLPVATRDAMIAASDSFGWDRTGLTATSTLRFILKYLSDQWEGIPLQLGGLVF